MVLVMRGYPYSDGTPWFVTDTVELAEEILARNRFFPTGVRGEYVSEPGTSGDEWAAPYEVEYIKE